MENSKMTKSEAGRLGCLKMSENVRRRYNENPKKCKFCGKDIPYELRHTNIFCNHECFSKSLSAKPKKERKCLVCGVKCKKIYCSHKCHIQHMRTDFIKRWKDGEIDGLSGLAVSFHIKNYFRDKQDNKCSKCNWGEKNKTTDTVPLQINHIDGNYKNCKEENLELICPNCHSLTHNYGALNRGNGRFERYNKNYDINTNMSME